MKKEKKQWENPKLICLYRGRPEEAVLVNCKTGQGVRGPANQRCWVAEEAPPCQVLGGTT